MNVGIIGTGYVGLVTGVCLASKGHRVTCFDVNQDIVDKLNKGVATIHEKGLQSMLNKVIKNNCFKAELMTYKTNFQYQIIFIAVGTPCFEDKIDLQYVEAAASQIGKYLKNNETFISIIVKSTVIPGTTDTLVRNTIESHSEKKLGEFGLGMNPEFLREGEAISDFMMPDRIVLGFEDIETLKVLKMLYSKWDCDKVEVNTRTAEMIKYANNSLLATQISAVNELANISSEIGGIDIKNVMHGVTLDRRWNPIKNNNRVNPGILSYLEPGCGFGGSCFPKDVSALRNFAIQIGAKSEILDSVLKINDEQPYQIIRLLNKKLNSLKSKKVLLLGLAFKPGTDDVRESVSIKILNYLLIEKAFVFVHDPVAMDNAKKIVQNNSQVVFVDNWPEKVQEADVVIIATNWDSYKELSELYLRKSLINKTVLDSRRFFDPNDFPESIYLSIGKS